MNAQPEHATIGSVTVSLPPKARIALTVNGTLKQLEVAPWTTLLDAPSAPAVLRSSGGVGSRPRPRSVSSSWPCSSSLVGVLLGVSLELLLLTSTVLVRIFANGS
jgi:hypothetical protein